MAIRKENHDEAQKRPASSAMGMPMMRGGDPKQQAEMLGHAWGDDVLILIYVALDLSLAEMPGAFVFDPAQSLESIDTARGR